MSEQNNEMAYTLAQFEHEKTQRIAALCEALKAVSSTLPNVITGYGNTGPGEQVLDMLKREYSTMFVSSLHCE